MLTHDTVGEIREADYPETWQSGAGEGLTFPISYHFEPGAADDGLTIDVPVATLNRVAADDFSWNVPGLREELVTGLIRSLPKHLRVNFVPAPNRAREFLAAVPAGEEPLLDALERYFRSTTGVVVPREAWDWTRVPEHLRPTYRVVDDSGREQARGKDLEALKEPLRPKFAQAMAEVAADSGVTRTGETDWVFGTVEASFTQKRAGHEVRGFPGLVDEGETVGLRVFGSEPEQEAQHRLGVRRLLLLTTAVAGEAGAGRPGQRPEARSRRVAVPHRRGAARGLPRRGRRRGGGRPAPGARRRRLRGAAGRGRRRPGGPPARGDDRRPDASSAPGAGPRRRSAAAPTC